VYELAESTVLANDLNWILRETEEWARDNWVLLEALELMKKNNPPRMQPKQVRKLACIKMLKCKKGYKFPNNSQLYYRVFDREPTQRCIF
jgi:hypothetical protein